MNPKNWKLHLWARYANLGFKLWSAAKEVVEAGADGKLDDAELDGIFDRTKETTKTLMKMAGYWKGDGDRAE